jgi:Cu-Zn family superoxide dismutase
MRHQIGRSIAGALLAITIALPATAADLIVKMQKVTQDGTSDALGTITIAGTDAGMTLKLDLHGLPPGEHGFHVHENGSCSPTLLNGVRIPAGAAGGHFDPEHAGKHAGPAGQGHMGDLPLIDVSSDGTAKQTLIAQRLKSADALVGHALVIHANGDTYSDSPAPLGGGGGRLACGLIQ